MSHGKQQRTRECRTKGHDWRPWVRRWSFKPSWGRVCRRCGASDIKYQETNPALGRDREVR